MHIRTASSEWPPRSKKFASGRTDGTPSTSSQIAAIVSPGRAKKYPDAAWTSSSVKAIMMPPTRSARKIASTEMRALPCVIRRKVPCHFDGGGGSVGS